MPVARGQTLPACRATSAGSPHGCHHASARQSIEDRFKRHRSQGRAGERGEPAPDKTVISLTPGLEEGRDKRIFLTKEVVRLVLDGLATEVACESYPPLAALIPGAELAGTVPLWEWIGDDHAVTFSC